MGAEEAAFDIDLGPYANWQEPERIVINVQALYREFGVTQRSVDPFAAWAAMARYRAQRVTTDRD